MAETEKLVDPAPNQLGDISASTTAFPLAGLQDATDSDRFHQGVAVAVKDSTGDGAYVSATAPMPVGYGQMRVVGSALGGSVSTSPNYSGWDQVGIAATIWNGSGVAAVWEIKEVVVDIDESIAGLAAGEGLELVVWGSDATVVLSTDNTELDSDTITGAVIPLTQTRNGYQTGGDRWQATGLSVVPFASQLIGLWTGPTYLAAALRYKGSTGWAFSSATAEISVYMLVRRVG